jgi:uncharacterized protein
VRLTIVRRLLPLLVIAVVYFAVMAFVHLADHLVLFPTRMPVATGGAVRKLIPFQDRELEIWTAKSHQAQQQGHADLFVLRFYGNADRADRWPAEEAEMWSGRAVEIWGMNYPGFGGSTGPGRLNRIGPAALAAFDELKRHATNRPIVPFGTSIGATAALHVAASRSCVGLILHNPVPLRELILWRFGWWNLWLLAGPVALQIPPELDSVKNAKSVRTPAIFLLAEKDEVVPPRYQTLVVDVYAGEKRVIQLPGAYHNDPIDATGLAELNNALGWVLAKSSSAPAR